MSNQFLSPEWIDEVRRIKVTHEGTPIDQDGLVVNATITGVPFGDGTLEVHSARGPVIGWEPGHVADPAFSLTVGYHLAREMVLDRSFDVLEQALNAGQITVSGDGSAFREWWQSRVGNPDAVVLDDQVRSVTS